MWFAHFIVRDLRVACTKYNSSRRCQYHFGRELIGSKLDPYIRLFSNKCQEYRGLQEQFCFVFFTTCSGAAGSTWRSSALRASTLTLIAVVLQAALSAPVWVCCPARARYPRHAAGTVTCLARGTFSLARTSRGCQGPQVGLICGGIVTFKY